MRTTLATIALATLALGLAACSGGGPTMLPVAPQGQQRLPQDAVGGGPPQSVPMDVVGGGPPQGSPLDVVGGGPPQTVQALRHALCNALGDNTRRGASQAEDPC